MKKNAFKLLSVFLSVLMIVMSVPLTAFAADVTDNTSEPVTLNTDIIELTDKRTATSKTFRLDDGSYYVAEYDTEIHYLDENGLWQDIDNTLAASGSEFSTNNAKIKFAKKITGNETIFTLHDGNRKLTLSLNGALKKTDGVITNASAELGEDATELQKMTTLEKISASILYADILPSTDLEYIVKGLTVKENIIVKEKADDYTYSFTMELNNLTATQAESGEIYITDTSTGDAVYYIPAPIMWDANHKTSSEVTMTLSGEAGEYMLTIAANADWMNAPDRVYPVTIDPPIYASGTADTLDLCITSEMPDFPIVEDVYLYVGNTWHAYWKWLNPLELPESAYLVNVELRLNAAAANGASGYVGVYDVLTDWDATLTWNSRSAGSAGTQTSAFTDYQQILGTSGAQDYTWNITPIVNKWLKDELNYGLMLAPVTGTTFNGIVEFRSAETSTVASRPRLTIQYRDMKGVEDYWSYVSQSAGFAGSGSVNLATGNLVFSIPTLTSMDALMPISPAMVYNSATASWQLNLAETLEKISYTNESGSAAYYYLWTDGDGTEHAFFPTDTAGVFRDEDGLLLTLTEGTSARTITDSGHNLRTFSPTGTANQYYLSAIADKSGNQVTFTVDSSYRVTAVSLIPNSLSAIEQLWIAYNADGTPYVVWDPTSGEGVVFRYTNSNLTSVVRAHGATAASVWQTYYNGGTGVTVVGTANYSYDSAGRLQNVINGLTGYQVIYAYTNGKVTSISEKGGTTAGQTLGITYGSAYAEVKTSGSDDAYGNSDDLITTYGFDAAGRAVSIYTTDLNRTQIYGASNGQYVEDNEKAKNSLQSSTETALHSANYLLNGGFESSLTYWNKTGTVTADTASPFLGTYAAKLTASRTSSAELSQTVQLPAGKYSLTLSTYSPEAAGLSVTVRVLSPMGSVLATDTVSVNEDNASETYQQVCISFTASSAGAYIVLVTVSSTSTDAESMWIDNAMLSSGTGAASFDLLQNGSFDTVNSSYPPSSSWTSSSAIALTASGISAFGNVLTVDPVLGTSRPIYQTVSIAHTDTAIYTVSGWAKGTAQSANPDAPFALRATVNYTNGSESFDLNFTKAITDWQFVSGSFVTNPDLGAVASVTVTILYEGHSGIGYFDGISLLRDNGNASVYEYNEQGLPSRHQTGKLVSWYQYDANNNIKAVVPSGRTIAEYVYDSANRLISEQHSRFTGRYDPPSATVTGTVSGTSVGGSVTGTVTKTLSYTYSYDNPYGLLTSTTAADRITGKTTAVQTTYNTDAGSHIFGTVKTETSPLGNVTRYFYSETKGHLLATVYPDNNGIVYTYDDVGYLTNATPAIYSQTNDTYAASTSSASITYTYDGAKRLSTVKTAEGTTYTFTYDSFSNTDTVKVGSRILADHTYNANNGKLNTLTYGNGDKVKYLYDALDRVAEIQYNIGSNGAFVTVYTYTYDTRGNLHSVTDVQSGQTTVYTYDGEGKRIHSYVYDTETYLNLYGARVTYDDALRVSTITHGFDYASSSGATNGAITYEYAYAPNGSISGYSAISDDSSYYAELTYDNFGRETGRIQGVTAGLSNTFFRNVSLTYVANGTTQSALVSSYTSTVAQSYDSSARYSFTYNYTYDANGNVTQVSDADGVLYKYTYDALGQLVREDNRELGYSYVYAYDKAGNLTSKETYPYATGTLGTATATVSYTYGDSEWADLLTKYGNTSITYDTIGNPLTIGTATLTWQGRQLMSYTDGNTTITYTYNADGIRTSKTITAGSNVTRHDYILNGSQIVRETVCLNSIEQYTVLYIYDESGTPWGMKYRTPSYAADAFDVYVFEKSLQGDIIAIYDDTTAKVVTYTYDAWGNATVEGASANTIGTLNPFRYRGYYHDSEVELYYVNSRYYNAEWGRFLNADSYLTTGQGLISFNMFAYCLNDPVNRIDVGGMASEDCFKEEDLLEQDPLQNGGGAIQNAKLAQGKITNSGSTRSNTSSSARSLSSARQSAVRKAWKIEQKNVQNGGNGVSRTWTEAEKIELISTGRVAGYVGHHMKSVYAHPNDAGDPANIQFLPTFQHIAAHCGNWRNPTHGRYEP